MKAKRKQKSTQIAKLVEKISPEIGLYEDVVQRVDKFNELVDRSNSGDEAALARLRGIFWSADGKFFVGMLGDAACQARQAVIDRLAPNQEAAQTAIRQYVGDLRRDLEGPNASAIERLLVERVAMTWLQVAHADQAAANAGVVNLKLADFNQRRLDRAHKRFLSAVKTLATVRRLALPIRVDVDLQVSGAVETRSKSEPALSASPVLRIPATRWETAGADN